MDLLYPLGTGSQWNNNEIRFSIRSAVKYYKFDNIFVVGDAKPSWLQNVTFIKQKDFSQYNKPGNIFYKIYKGCLHPDLSDVFLFMADDYLFNKPVESIPIYSRNTPLWTFGEPSPSNQFAKTRQLTAKYLRAKKCPTVNFDIHAPMPVNKKKFKLMAESFEHPYKGNPGWNVMYRSISWRSSYGNYIKAPARPSEDFRAWGFEEPAFKEQLIRAGQASREKLYAPIEETVKDMPFFSMGIPIGSECQWIKDKFPDKSKYEKSKSDNYIKL